MEWRVSGLSVAVSGNRGREQRPPAFCSVRLYFGCIILVTGQKGGARSPGWHFSRDPFCCTVVYSSVQ